MAQKGSEPYNKEVNKMNFFKKLILSWILCWSSLGICQSYQLVRRSRQLDVFNQNQLTALEILIADRLLKRVNQTEKSKNTTSLQKKQTAQDAGYALALYVQVLENLSEEEEKAKIYFRMGHLYEALQLNYKAAESYQKAALMSRQFQRVKKAYQRLNRMQKEKKTPKSSSQVSLSFVQKLQFQSIVKTEKELLQTQNLIQSGQWDSAVQLFKQACRKYSNSYPCSIAECSHFSSSIRAVLRLAQEQGRGRPQHLSSLYEIYLSYFPRDLLVNVLASQWFLKRKQYEKAMKFYQRYILFETKFIHLKVHSLKEKRERFQELEPVFYFHQRIAHLSRRPRLKLQSYDFYLKGSVRKEHLSRVMYLRNVAFFQLGQYAKTAPVFRQIAMAEYKDISVREKSAVYAVQALIQLNRLITARKWVDQFSNLFPSKKDMFRQLLHSH